MFPKNECNKEGKEKRHEELKKSEGPNQSQRKHTKGWRQESNTNTLEVDIIKDMQIIIWINYG